MKELLMELTGLEMTAVHRAVMLEVAVWAVMLAAVYIDYRTGIRRRGCWGFRGTATESAGPFPSSGTTARWPGC